MEPKKYYIYLIPGVKIGVTTNPQYRNRRLRAQGFEILEEHTDISTVSDREIELQLKYFGKRDNPVRYEKTISIHAKRGAPQKMELQTCPYCKKEGKGPIMKRFHFENCKSNDPENYKKRIQESYGHTKDELESQIRELKHIIDLLNKEIADLKKRNL